MNSRGKAWIGSAMMIASLGTWSSGMSSSSSALMSTPFGVSRGHEVIRVRLRLEAFPQTTVLLPGDTISLVRKTGKKTLEIGHDLSILSIENTPGTSVVVADIIAPRHTAKHFDLSSTESDLVVTKFAH